LTLDSVEGLKTLLGSYFGHLVPHFMPKRFAPFTNYRLKLTFSLAWATLENVGV